MCQVENPGQAMKDLGSLSRQRGTMPAVCVSTCMYCAVKVAVVGADAFLSLLGSEIVNS